MKKSYLFGIVFLFCISINAQVITIPDVYFKNKLVTSTTSNGVAKDSFGNSIKVDANNNGEIEVSEIQNIAAINVAGFSPNNSGNIVSMDGIQNFANLKILKCSSNHITSLDLTALTLLEDINCGHNNLTNLNVSGLTNLKNLQCDFNNLSSFDTSGLSSLKTLYVFNNNISTLNLNNLPQLITLWCSANDISNLDVSGLSNIKHVYCGGNLMTNLNVQNVSSLIELDCDGNLLTSLNLSGLNNLTHLNISNNLLSTINVLPLTSISSLHCGGNPLTSIDINGLSTLYMLQIDETLISTLDCSQSGVTQVSCANNPNLTYINVRNGHFTSSDPDLLSFGFTFENLPALTGICLDLGEEVNLNYTNYNSSGNVILYTGASCDIIVPFNPMSADEFSAVDDFKIYPNPVNTMLNVVIGDGTAIKGIQIYNSLGQLVQTVSDFNGTSSKNLDVSHLESGYYLMHIVSDKGNVIEKFIKN